MTSTGNQRTHTRNRRRDKREFYLLYLGVLALLIFISAVFLVARYQPGAERTPEQSSSGDSPLQNRSIQDISKIRETIAHNQKSLESKIQGNSVDLQDLEMMDDSIKLLRSAIRKNPSRAQEEDRDTLEELEEAYDKQMGIFLYAQSVRLEEEAKRYHESNQVQEAQQALETACNLQKKINEQFARSDRRDHARLHLLSERLMRWKTEPIAEKADQLKREALLLMESGDYAMARNRMDLALNQQRLLNRNFRTSPFSSLSRLKEFEGAWKTIQAAEDLNAVSRLVEEAQASLNSGDFKAALDTATQARERQAVVLEKYPVASRSGSLGTQEINKIIDTAASVEAFRNVNEKELRCRTLLRNRQLDPFINASSAWLRASEAFVEKYPLSDFANQIDMEEVMYLHGKREALPTVLDTVFSNLIPLPGTTNISMYRTEVPQFLYQTVMDQNPSSNKDPLLPVESVTWNEAQRFSSLLSWILASPVKLPNKKQFMAALGEVRMEELTDQAWSNRNSDYLTQPVGSKASNPAGFSDLLGNVAEWLAQPEAKASGKATLIGGSSRNNSESLSAVPEETLGVDERNRFVGFRFVVELRD